MKLTIKREQVTERVGMLGLEESMTFLLHVRLVLDANETQLTERHYAGVKQKIFWSSADSQTIYTMKDMTKGFTHRSVDVFVALDTEQSIKDNCRILKDRLTLMESFGGEEVLDIT